MKFVDSIISIKITCPICGKEHKVEVSEHEFAQWELGMDCIQNAMPTLSATEREQIISHICPKCQANIFGTDEEEDEGDDISACMQESLDFTGQWW